MAFQFGSALRNNQVSQIQTTIAAAGTTNMTLVIYTGSEPASCSAATTGTALVSIVLPASFLTSSGGATTLAGSWSASASATGTAGYFRIFDMAGTPVCHVQGNVTSDLVLNNTSIASGQTVTVNSFTVTMGNS